MAIVQAFDAMRTTEKRTLSWDFKNDVPTGVTISSGTVTATVKSGTDASPSDIVSGAATVSGTKVLQLIDATAAVEGVEYYLEWQATLSDGQIFEELSTLKVDDPET